MDTLVIDTVKSFGKLYPDHEAEVAQIIELLEARKSFKALKIAHAMLAEQGKAAAATLTPVPEPQPASL